MRQPRENLFHLKEKLHNSGEHSFFLHTQSLMEKHTYTHRKKNPLTVNTQKLKRIFFYHHSQGDHYGF